MHTVAVWEEWGVPVLEPKMVTAPLLICLVSTLCVHLPIDTVCYMCPWWEVPELVSVTCSLSRSQHLSTVTINNSNFPRWWGVKWHEVFRWGPSAMGETHGKLLCVWISELLREKKMFGSQPARGNGLNQLQFKKIAWMFVNGKTMFTPLLAAQA